MGYGKSKLKVNPKKDRDGLTKSQRVFADNVLEVGAKEAARIAYPDAINPTDAANKTLASPVVQDVVSRMADQRGLTKEACLDAIKNGLDATRKIATKTDVIEFDDHPTRLKAAELGLRVHGALKEDVRVQANFFGPEAYAEFCAAYFKKQSKEGNGDQLV